MSIYEQMLAALGRSVTLTRKDKRTFGKVESAFLKDNTEVVNLQFQTEKSVKIKIEVDTCPPMGFATEQRLSVHPHSFYTRCLAPSDLFAGKMHALLFRQWKSRVKGRDWYDWEWYVRQGIPMHFAHFQERTRQFNGMEVTQERFAELLEEKIATTDLRLVCEDVLPFLIRPEEIKIWSQEYFRQIAGMIRME